MAPLRSLVLCLCAALFAGGATLFAQAGAPNSPTNLAASATGSTVTITWQPGAGPAATGYQLEAAVSPLGAAVASVPVAAPALLATNVPDGTYFVRVRAVNATGVSLPSAEVAVMVGVAACGAPPVAPVALTQSVAGGLVTFAWTPGAGGCAPTHYVLSAGSAPSLSNIVSLNVGLQTALAAPAPPGTYHVRVAAANAWGTSVPSNEVVVSIGASCTVPGAPEAFTATGSATFASFQWQPPLTGDAPTGYLLEAGTSATGAEIAVLPVSGLSFGTPAPPGAYYVRVRAQNACGTGPASSTQLLTIGQAPVSTRVIAVSGNLAFGAVTVGQITSATVTIANTGNSPLTFTSITCTCNVSVFGASPTSGTVPPGGSRTVTVSFGPLASVVYGGTLTVMSDATAGSASLVVSGTGVSVPPPPPPPWYHVWGGAGYTQYLGYWTCTFCVEYGADSINNTYGTHGSAFSSTSMRNSFSQYGSPYSSYSACNQFASSPPRVFSADGRIYYGELTVNPYRAEAITASGVVSWLVNDVCQ